MNVGAHLFRSGVQMGIERSFLVKARMRPEPNHATDELGREAPEEIRPPSPRATPPTVRSRREHPGESVEVEAFVHRPAARINDPVNV